MRPELNQQLKDKYPKIISGGRFRCFEVGDGWYQLLDEALGKLQTRVDESGCTQLEAVQIKEKFGTLRFYKSGGDEVCNMIIAEAEAKSAKTCGTCGEPGGKGSGFMDSSCLPGSRRASGTLLIDLRESLRTP